MAGANAQLLVGSNAALIPQTLPPFTHIGMPITPEHPLSAQLYESTMTLKLLLDQQRTALNELTSSQCPEKVKRNMERLVRLLTTIDSSFQNLTDYEGLLNDRQKSNNTLFELWQVINRVQTSKRWKIVRKYCSQNQIASWKEFETFATFLYNAVEQFDEYLRGASNEDFARMHLQNSPFYTYLRQRFSAQQSNN